MIAWTHHEHFDGNGCPRGLVGEEIPLEGRIASVADVFDALTSDWIYRPAFGLEETVELMRRGRGRQFDPLVLDAFLESMTEVETIAAASGVAEDPGPVTASRRGGRDALAIDESAASPDPFEPLDAERLRAARAKHRSSPRHGCAGTACDHAAFAALTDGFEGRLLVSTYIWNTSSSG